MHWLLQDWLTRCHLPESAVTDSAAAAAAAAVSKGQVSLSLSDLLVLQCLLYQHVDSDDAIGSYTTLVKSDVDRRNSKHCLTTVNPDWLQPPSSV